MSTGPRNAALKQDPRKLLNAFGLRPKKRLGQNFLVSDDALHKVLDAAQLTGGEDVLEIGAGLGSLSLLLAELAGRVVAVEIDRDLIPALSWVLEGLPNVELRVGDILSMELSELGLRNGYIVVANIPYPITSMLIRKLLESDHPARRIILTIQREVAERITAAPGEKSLLSLSVEVFGHAEIFARVGAEAFFPKPAVESAVIRIDRHPAPAVPGVQLDRFFSLARAGFGQRRKQLQNALASGLGVPKHRIREGLESAEIEPSIRAQALGVDDWLRILASFEAIGIWD